jgi:hypothetical protein
VLGGDLDHDSPVRVGAELFDECTELSDVVEHVMARDHIGGTYRPRDIWPRTAHCVELEPAQGSRARHELERSPIAIDGGDRVSPRRQTKTRRPGSSSDIKNRPLRVQHPEGSLE